LSPESTHVKFPDGFLNAKRYRNYHPTLGRWIERDPAGYLDGVSLYGYVSGDPAGLTDPTGLCGETAPEPGHISPWWIKRTGPNTFEMLLPWIEGMGTEIRLLPWLPGMWAEGGPLPLWVDPATAGYYGVSPLAPPYQFDPIPLPIGPADHEWWAHWERMLREMDVQERQRLKEGDKPLEPEGQALLRWLYDAVTDAFLWPEWKGLLDGILGLVPPATSSRFTGDPLQADSFGAGIPDTKGAGTIGLDQGSGDAKQSPSFLPATHAPQPPLEQLPPGHGVRIMPPAPGYGNGYWVETNKHGQPVDPTTGKPVPNVTRPEARSRTHVPLPPGWKPPAKLPPGWNLSPRWPTPPRIDPQLLEPEGGGPRFVPPKGGRLR